MNKAISYYDLEESHKTLIDRVMATLATDILCRLTGQEDIMLVRSKKEKINPVKDFLDKVLGFTSEGDDPVTFKCSIVYNDKKSCVEMEVLYAMSVVKKEAIIVTDVEDMIAVHYRDACKSFLAEVGEGLFEENISLEKALAEVTPKILIQE